MANTLNANEQLTVGQELRSNNDDYRLLMQGDGNLVLYEGTSSPVPVWDSGTWALPAAHRPVRAVMQGDGNFVLYDAGNVPAWDTGTWTYPGSRLVLQDDRNLVMYGPNNAIIWSTDTWLRPELRVSKFDTVGHGKTMNTNATLYTNGSLVVDSYEKNDNWVGALRGRILIVCVDGRGRAHWVSNVFQCATACAIPDVSCASYRRQTFYDNFPAPVGQFTRRLDIYQADEPNYVDLRASIINGIKAAGDIVQEVKDVLGQLNI